MMNLASGLLIVTHHSLHHRYSGAGRDITYQEVVHSDYLLDSSSAAPVTPWACNSAWQSGEAGQTASSLTFARVLSKEPDFGEIHISIVANINGYLALGIPSFSA